MNGKYNDTQLFWQILREWNKSKRESVSLTVEQALLDLNRIIERQPLTLLAFKARQLVIAIVTRQDDTSLEQEIAMDTSPVDSSFEEEDSSQQKDYQETLAN